MDMVNNGTRFRTNQLRMNWENGQVQKQTNVQTIVLFNESTW